MTVKIFSNETDLLLHRTVRTCLYEFRPLAEQEGENEQVAQRFFEDLRRFMISWLTERKWLNVTSAPAADPKRITAREFRQLGYLQELNRRFLHPLGLALEAQFDNCPECVGEGGNDQVARFRNRDRSCALCDGQGVVGDGRISGVWDYRDDPEGLIFGDLTDEHLERARRIERELRKCGAVRMKRLGWVVQPVVRSEGRGEV